MDDILEIIQLYILADEEVKDAVRQTLTYLISSDDSPAEV